MCYCTLWYLDNTDAAASLDSDEKRGCEANEEVSSLQDVCSPGVQSFVSDCVDKAKNQGYNTRKQTMEALFQGDVRL